MNAKGKENIRFAFIGCGKIAEKHITALSRISGAEVVGVYDVNYPAAENFAKKHDLTAFKSIEDLVSGSNPDVFNILTPSGLHADNVMKLIKYDRHFVVEKPLSLRLEDIDKIICACQDRSLELFVVKQNRFNPPVKKLKEAVDSGRFGKMVLGIVRVRWKRDQAYYDQKKWRGTLDMDGGVMMNQASHHIDTLLWMMGPVRSVTAKTSTRLVDIEAEDTGVAILKFESGALGVIEATTAARPSDLEGSLSVMGEGGTVEVGGFFMNQLKTWSFEGQGKIDEEVWEKHSKVPDEIAWNHTEFFNNVVLSLRKGEKGLIDGREGRRSVELVNAIYESARTGKEVFLGDSLERRIAKVQI